MLFREYLSQFVFVEVLALLVGLNAFVTYRSAGRNIPCMIRLPLSGWIMVGFGHLMLGFWMAVGLEFGWAASLLIVLLGAFILLVPYTGWVLKALSLAVLAGAVWLLLEHPGPLAAMLFCLTPMLALMGSSKRCARWSGRGQGDGYPAFGFGWGCSW